MTLRRTAAVVLLAMVPLTTLVACGDDDDDDASTGGGGSDELTPIGIEALTGTMASLLDYVADEEGFFNDRGLEPSFSPAATGQDGLALAVAGEVDVFLTTPAYTNPVMEQGECFTYLHPNQTPTINIIAGPDVELEHAGEPYPDNILDLEGKTIGTTSLGSFIQVLGELALEDAGLSTDDVTWVATGGTQTATAALQEGQVDVLISFPPMEQVLVEGEDYQMVADFVGNTGDPLDDILTGPSAVACEFLEENEDVAMDYCRALWDAEDFVLDPANTDRVVEILTERMPIEADLAAGLWESFATTFERRPFTEELWDYQADFSEGTHPSFEDAVYEPCTETDPRE